MISGRVQGVYYRANVAKNANSTGFSGYVKNLNDGSVEVCVSCEKSDLEVFKRILKRGSPASSVTSIEEHLCSEVFSAGFEVRT